MTVNLNDRVAMVTGGASGIGRAVAHRLLSAGACVGVVDVNESGGNETVETGASERIAFFRADVSASSDVQKAVQAIIEHFGRLDLACNAAGVMGSPAARTADCTEDNWELVLRTNLTGTWLCMKYQLRAMRKQKRGALVNVASAAGLSGSFVSAPYVASKHGILGLTRIAALECAFDGIRVNAVCPGYVRTPMLEKLVRLAPGLEDRLTRRTPLSRLGTPEEVAEAVAWLMSDHAAFVTGHALSVDGGLVLAS